MGAALAYLLTPSVRDDIGEIWLYIASENPAAADVLEDEFFAAFERLT